MIVVKSWIRKAAALSALLMGTIGPVMAQVASTPFAITGNIQSFTMDPGTPLPGASGTITVNNTTVVLPQNTIIAFPAAYYAVDQVFGVAAILGDAPGSSGLALNDPAPKRPGIYDVSISGNIVAGPGGSPIYVAGLDLPRING